jgi:hypothetical protein
MSRLESPAEVRRDAKWTIGFAKLIGPMRRLAEAQRRVDEQATKDFMAFCDIMLDYGCTGPMPASMNIGIDE